MIATSPPDDREAFLAHGRARMSQCPHRYEMGCRLIDSVLGWRDGVDRSVCDCCHDAGPSTEAGGAVREHYTRRVLLTIRSMAPVCQDGLLRVMADRHGDDRCRSIAESGAHWKRWRDMNPCHFRRLSRRLGPSRLNDLVDLLENTP